MIHLLRAEIMCAPDSTNQGNRADAVRAVIDAYLDLPDTPDQASPRDFLIVTSLVNDGIPLALILRAIKLGFIRRWARDHAAGSLPPVRSFAYFKAVLNGLSESERSDEYALYIDYKFAQIRPDPRAWVKAQTQQIPADQ
jgi:hypothetical protein